MPRGRGRVATIERGGGCALAVEGVKSARLNEYPGKRTLKPGGTTFF